MKIIAASAVPTGENAENVLQIANDADLAALHASGALQGVERIELQFPKFTDGRAYSQALLLRRRYQFAGDIRATGDVLIDQLVHMHPVALAAPCWQAAWMPARPSASSPVLLPSTRAM